MIAELLTTNTPNKPELVKIVKDILYRQNLFAKKQQKQYNSDTISQSFTGYTLKYYNNVAPAGPYSDNNINYEFIPLNTTKETFIEIKLKIYVNTVGIQPPDFQTQVYFVVFDGINNVLQTYPVSSLQVPNTELSFASSFGFELTNLREQIFVGLFVDENLTIDEKDYIDDFIYINWSIIINQNEII